jgi:hypothetical protein
MELGLDTRHGSIHIEEARKDEYVVCIVAPLGHCNPLPRTMPRYREGHVHASMHENAQGAYGMIL